MVYPLYGYTTAVAVTHSPTDESSRCFYVGPLNKGAMNVYVQVFGYMFVCVCVRNIPKSGIIGTYDKYLFILQIKSPK